MRFFTLILLFLFGLEAYAQERIEARPKFDHLPFMNTTIDENTPQWARKMYEENPNMREVKRLYDLWRLEYPGVRNAHTQNFKHLYRYLVAHEGIDERGYIIPDFELKSHERTKAWQRKKLQMSREAKARFSVSGSAPTDWESMGPFIHYDRNGLFNRQVNIYSLTQSKSDPNILYAVSEGGGTVFKTLDKGNSWFSPNDNYTFDYERQIEVDPTNPNIVYCTGRNDIFKSTDGALNWTSVYNNTNSRMRALIIDDTNPQNILAAGVEGILRTTDGGSTWTKVQTGNFYDIKYRPRDPMTVYALRETPSTNQIDFFKSTDGGVTWTQVTAGWPTEASTGVVAGRMAVSDADSLIVYAFIGAKWTAAPSSFQGVKVMKSTDGGDSWITALNYDDLNGVNQGQGFFDWDIEASDNDPDIVLFGTQGRWLTTDGFATNNWAKTGWELGHEDAQEILFNGDDLWLANDGGIIKFTDETFDQYEIKSEGINATSFWYFEQGWNRDAQAGVHYHNGTSGRQETYDVGQYRTYKGGEPPFVAIAHPNPDRLWSLGGGSAATGVHTLPDNISDPTLYTPYNIVPNAAVGANTWEESEIAVYPPSYNTHFTGSGNSLWRSDDFGLTWSVVHTFPGEKVTKIEIPRDDTDRMYVAVYSSSGYRLYRSDNLGASFTLLPNPPGFSTSGVFISVDQGDANTIYMCGRYASGHVWKSTNGGNSWTDIYTSALSGQALRAIKHIGGTNGGVYVLSLTSAFYRNNTMSSWQMLSTNLPVRPQLRDIKPFYKEGKIRIAGDARGVWGADLYEPSGTIAQATVNNSTVYCSRDTLFFDDFSIVHHAGASWSWSFPGASYVSSTTVRNPKVVYSQSGSYTATMTLTKNGVPYQSQITVTIDNRCDPEEVPGNAMICSNSGDYAIIDGFDIDDTSSVTFMAWIKPDGIQNDYTGILIGSTTFGFNFRSNNRIGYHWPGGRWWWDSGLVAPVNEWSHVALVKTPGAITIYVNGESATDSVALGDPDFRSTKIRLGSYNGWWNRNYFGIIDEVAVYKRGMTREEIREQMHLTKYPDKDPDLVHYYQFNNASGVIMDRVSNRHATWNGAAGRTTSTGPFGGGVSDRLTVTDGGLYAFANTEVDIDFSDTGTTPDGDLIVYRIDAANPHNPAGSPQIPDLGYWIVRNYGANASFSELDFIDFKALNLSAGTNPSSYQLYKRQSNDDGDTWGNVQDVGDETSATHIKFSNGNGITEFSQFTIIQGAALPVDLLMFSVRPASNNQDVILSWSTAQEYNNERFELERSVNGVDFETIGTVLSKTQNSNQIQAYQYTDYKPGRGHFYYRLKQIDVDGSFEYSPVKSVLIQYLPSEFVIAPNPVFVGYELSIYTQYEANYLLSIWDASGKSIFSSTLSGDQNLRLAKLSAGLYNYRIVYGGQMTFGKIMVLSR